MPDLTAQKTTFISRPRSNDLAFMKLWLILSTAINSSYVTVLEYICVFPFSSHCLSGSFPPKREDGDSAPNATSRTEFSRRVDRVLTLSVWVTLEHRGSDVTSFWRQNKTDQVFLFCPHSQSLGLAVMDSI